MRTTLLNVAMAACLFGLAGVNLAFNPFLPAAWASGEPCAGSPPCANCECCVECGCWVCDCDGDGNPDY